MLTDQEEQAEKRRTLLNDARVREQSNSGDTGTFLSHTHIDDAGGRFAAVNAAKIVGQLPTIAAGYPAASAAHQTELPPEGPLGYSIDAMPGDEPSTAPPVEATGDPAQAPSSDDGGPLDAAGRSGDPCERSTAPEDPEPERGDELLSAARRDLAQPPGLVSAASG